MAASHVTKSKYGVLRDLILLRGISIPWLGP
jgi:hypothetical protein